jgi:hypothetical protein
VKEFGACWEGLEDPRSGNAAMHDMSMIALCTGLSEGENATDMAEFAKAKEPFLLPLRNGIPSRDTFSRLFRLLDPEKFGAAFQRFMVAFSQQCQGVVAIDGEGSAALARSRQVKIGFAYGQRMGLPATHVTGADRDGGESNEITAVPKLLEMLSLKGMIVTTDALSCPRAIAQQIINQGGDHGSPNTLGHSPKARLVVTITEVRS